MHVSRFSQHGVGLPGLWSVVPESPESQWQIQPPVALLKHVHIWQTARRRHQGLLHAGWVDHVFLVQHSTTEYNEKKEVKRDKHNSELQRAAHGTKGCLFPSQCPKRIFIISIVYVEKKHTKLIYHMT